MVFDTQGDKILTKSLNVLKRGGQIIRISGPPDLNFAEAIHANWLLKKVIPLLSWSIRCKAKQRGIDYSFLFMQPNGAQLTQITQLVEAESLNPSLIESTILIKPKNHCNMSILDDQKEKLF